MSENKMREQTVSRYGEEFAKHVDEVFADIGIDIDFCICNWCGQPFPKGQEVEGTEDCSKECYDAGMHHAFGARWDIKKAQDELKEK